MCPIQTTADINKYKMSEGNAYSKTASNLQPNINSSQRNAQ